MGFLVVVVVALVAAVAAVGLVVLFVRRTTESPERDGTSANRRP